MADQVNCMATRIQKILFVIGPSALNHEDQVGRVEHDRRLAPDGRAARKMIAITTTRCLESLVRKLAPLSTAEAVDPRAATRERTNT